MITFENIISDRGSKYSVSGCSVSNKLEIKKAIKLLKIKKNMQKQRIIHGQLFSLLREQLKVMMENLVLE
jgi:hypothetical protein